MGGAIRSWLQRLVLRIALAPVDTYVGVVTFSDLMLRRGNRDVELLGGVDELRELPIQTDDIHSDQRHQRVEDR